MCGGPGVVVLGQSQSNVPVFVLVTLLQLRKTDAVEIWLAAGKKLEV